MIAVDTSALLAIILREPEADACLAALLADNEVLLSAGTLAELLVVGAGRGLLDEVEPLLRDLNPTVVPVTARSAHGVGQAYLRWGKGMHPAALNYGDCFAYEVAREYGCDLLFVGQDFSKTDVTSVL